MTKSIKFTDEEKQNIKYTYEKLEHVLGFMFGILVDMDLFVRSENPYPNNKVYSQLDTLKRMNENFSTILMTQDMPFEKDEDMIVKNLDYINDFFNSFITRSYEDGPALSILSDADKDDIRREHEEAHDILMILTKFYYSSNDPYNEGTIDLLKSYQYIKRNILISLKLMRNGKYKDDNGKECFNDIPTKNLDLIEKFLEPYITEDFENILSKETEKEKYEKVNKIMFG